MTRIDRQDLRHGSTWICALAFAALITSMQAESAWAQAYKQLKPAVAPAAAPALRGKATNVLRDAAPPAAAALKTLDEYFIGWYFPMMTQYSNPAQLGALAKLRKELFVQYINIAKTPPARDHVVGLALKACRSIASGGYHPAVRYNAALILGQLDLSATGGEGGRPQPSPDATQALIKLLTDEKIGEVAVPSSAKIAALVGLERHTRIGVNPQLAETITAAVMPVATRKEPPADIPADVNAWMRRMAAQVLANQFAAGFTAPVHEAFVTLIGSDELNLDDRSAVANMLLPGMYANVQGVDAGQAADALGRLAKAILNEESTKAEEYQEALLNDPTMAGGFGGGFDGGRGGFGGGRGGYGGGRGGFDGGRGGFDGGMGMGAPQGPQGPHFEKRRTLDRIAGLVAGLNAISGAGSGDVQKRVTDLLTPIREAAEKMADDKVAELAVAESVVELANEVNDIIAGWTAGAEPAAEGGDEAEEGEFGEGQ
jgi:hypothetical protein